MGSVRSARRIQPGGTGPAGPGSPRTLPRPPSSLAGGGTRRRGRRGPDGPGPRRAHFLRGGAPRPAPGRLGRLRGGRWPGRLAAVRRYSPPQAAASPSPGAEGADRLRALPPLNRPVPVSPPGGAGARGGEGGRGPPLPARLSTGVNCPQCAPAAPPRREGPRLHVGARGPRRRR